jgi:hypothetical protein
MRPLYRSDKGDDLIAIATSRRAVRNALTAGLSVNPSGLGISYAP